MGTAIAEADPGEASAETARARQILDHVDRILGQAREQGRVVDYLELRANCLRHGLRVAEFARQTYKADDDKPFGFPDICENSIRYLKSTAPGLLADAKAGTTNPPRFQRVIPRPDLREAWTVRDANIYLDDEPVTLHGIVWTYSARDPHYRLDDIGLNMQTLDIGPRSFMPNSYEFEDTGGSGALQGHLRRQGLLAQELNEVLDLHTSPHYLPQWFTDDLRNQYSDELWNWHGGGYAWMNTDKGRRLLDRLYQSLQRTYGDLRSVKTADLANEWVYCDPTPEALDEFRQWLSNRHGSLDVLNGRWGTQLESFQQVSNPYPGQILVPEGIYRERGPYWDWCCFTSQRAASVVRWMNDTFKQRFPGPLTHIKLTLSAYAYRSLSEHFRYGIDPQQILPITDLLGTDGSYVRGATWQSTLFVYDYMKSICPDKPIYNSEWHAVPYDESAPEEIRRSKFQLFVHGERINTLFLNTSTAVPTYWGPLAGEPHFNISLSPAALQSLAVTSADLRRLAPQLRGFALRRPSLLIFYDNAADFGIPQSETPPGQFADRVLKVHASLIPWDVKVGVVTETMLAQGLPEQPLIILAGAQFVSDGTVSRLKEYVACGGLVLWLGDNLRFDHYGRKRDDPALEAFADGKAAVRASSDADLNAIWPKLLAEAQVECPFSTKTKAGAVAAGLELLSARDADGRPLIFLANTGPGPAEFALVSKETDGTELRDLVTGNNLKAESIYLHRNQVMLLKAVPRE